MGKYFFVDAETDGLYGSFLSVAVIVTDRTGTELDRFYGAVQIHPDAISSDWVKENVLPHLHEAEVFYPDENTLLEAFWAFWMKHHESCLCIADVPFPVEARLFMKCVELCPADRSFSAPFPLLDLASVLAANGISPLADRAALSGLGLTAHDAMHDVRMMVQLWNRYMKNGSDRLA
ncbi:MAG: hypothetical protein IJ496_07955 [Ruminococcus sp.]|nr:hypothetical protein [Ruminococcus sp.]